MLVSRLVAELLLLSFLLKRGVVGTATVLTAAATDPWCPRLKMPHHAMAAQPLPLLSHTLTLYPTAPKQGERKS